MLSAPARSRLLPHDVLRVALVGLRARRLRAALSALGIAIGIASMVAVLGISASSRADLLATLDALGTNLLEVKPGQSVFGEDTTLPKTAATMIRRVDGVEAVAGLSLVDGASVRRSERIDELETGGIGVYAADPSLARTLGVGVRRGRFLDRATARRSVVVLGAVAARRLGISEPGVQVVIGGRRYTVLGILRPATLAPDVDRAALLGYGTAHAGFGTTRSASTVFVRTDEERVGSVRALLGATAKPGHAEEVEVSRPSDALAARAAAKAAFTGLLLGLGLVALLVGGVGIANVMVISVLERRSEIGLRRALGARRGHVATQFLAESLVLGAAGGVTGSGLAALVTASYAASRGWRLDLSLEALAAGVAAAVAIGALAGLYPALRAARLSPTEALRTA